MDVVVALHAAAALLLLVAGMAKIVRPAPTTDLLVALGLPGRAEMVVGIGVVEVIVGLGALAVGGPVTAMATGVLYVGFTGAVVRAMRAGAASCGCFGRIDAPPSWLHVGGNAALAALSFVAAGGDAPIDVMDGQPAGGIGFVVLVGVLAGLFLVVFTALPEALSARTGSTPTPQTFRIDPELTATARPPGDHAESSGGVS